MTMKLLGTSLIIVCLALGLGWWFVAIDSCPAPLTYRLGTLDERFGLTEDEAKAYIETAAAVWEGTVGRELLSYDDQSDFVVDFIFDDRQARANSEASIRTRLDSAQEANEELRAQIESLRSEYEALSTNFEAQKSAYEADLATYNEEVRRYNDRGGAPSDIHATLEAQRVELDNRAQSLNRTAAELNALAENLNRLGEEGNRRVDLYNDQVDDYNERYGYIGEFTQGDYQGDGIHIYKFSTTDELTRVLTHEFGHALGVDHVEGSESVMYYLMEEPVAAPVLSDADLAAFIAVCGTGDELPYRIRVWLARWL